MFRKLLCPVDFSEGAHHAMRVAVRLANEADAELEILHVWHIPAIGFSIEAPFPADAIEKMIVDEEKGLARAVADAKELGATRLTSRFVRGLPADQICDVATADPDCDLVVVGTHGRTGLSRVLLGSVAEKVVRHAPCSVLAVRSRDSVPPFRRILCAVDFSAQSRHALEIAAKLAVPGGLGITLLHVAEVPVYGGESSMVDYVAAGHRAAVKLLEEWEQDLRAKVHVPVEARMLIGPPVAQTLNVLEDEPSFDLVVVGSHGRTGVSRILLGSVAERIVRHAPCPVLVARART